jgi:hypothetical protein
MGFHWIAFAQAWFSLFVNFANRIWLDDKISSLFFSQQSSKERERERERERGSKEYGKSDMDFHRIEFALLCSVLALCSLWIMQTGFDYRDEKYNKIVLVTWILKKKRDARKSAVADLEKINKRSDQRNNKQWFRSM